MALTSHLTKRLDLPHEPGEWVEVRMPSLRMLHELSAYDDSYEGMVKLVSQCVLSWSYPVGVSEDSIWDLDAETAGFIAKALNAAKSEDEEKNS